MSKSRHKYRDDDEDGVMDRKPGANRHKEKRLDRALRTKNIDELMELDDDYHDTDPCEGYYGDEDDIADEEYRKWINE